VNTTPWTGLRISDAERESAVHALGEHYAAGRITREEYDERAERAWAARTAAEVMPLFTDLPSPHPYAPRSAGTPAGAARGRPTSGPARAAGPWPAPRSPLRRGAPLPLVPLVLLVVGLALLLHAPFLVLLVLGALWFGRSRGRC
jgi:hypothetical protein